MMSLLCFCCFNLNQRRVLALPLYQVPRSVSAHVRTTTKQIVQKWMYSWMNGLVETEEEYKISKALLIHYLKSNALQEKAGESNLDRIVTFVRKNVEPHEANYCFYLRIGIRHFEEYTNSSHEGTNNGLKHSAAPVLPVMSLQRTTEVLTDNAAMKCLAQEKVAAKQATEHKLWSDLPTAGHLVTRAEALLHNEWDERHNYDLERHSSSLFMVRRKENTEEKRRNAVVPRFRRVREVQIVERDIFGRKCDCLVCSCCLFERVGIPCRHIQCVLNLLLDNFQGVSHHQVAVRWWSMYSHAAYKKKGGLSEKEKKLCETLEAVRGNDITAVPLPALNKLKEIEISEEKTIAPQCAVDSCLNYSPSIIREALNSAGGYDHNRRVGTVPVAMSQDTYFPQDDDDSPLQEDDDDDEGLISSMDEIVEQQNQQFPNDGIGYVGFPMCTRYEQIMPQCKEFITTFEGHTTKEDDEAVKGVLLAMQEAVAKKRAATALEDSGNSVPKGTRVSVCAKTNKKLKTHGSMHLR